MITNPSPAALKALHAFGSHTGWSEVQKYLEGELQALYRHISEAREDVTLRQMQGRAQLIKELLGLVREAPTTLNRLKVSTL
jgi:hypothetical protein